MRRRKTEGNLMRAAATRENRKKGCLLRCGLLFCLAWYDLMRERERERKKIGPGSQKKSDGCNALMQQDWGQKGCSSSVS